MSSSKLIGERVECLNDEILTWFDDSSSYLSFLQEYNLDQDNATSQTPPPFGKDFIHPYVTKVTSLAETRTAAAISTTIADHLLCSNFCTTTLTNCQISSELLSQLSDTTVATTERDNSITLSVASSEMSSMAPRMPSCDSEVTSTLPSELSQRPFPQSPVISAAPSILTAQTKDFPLVNEDLTLLRGGENCRIKVPNHSVVQGIMRIICWSIQIHFVISVDGLVIIFGAHLDIRISVVSRLMQFLEYPNSSTYSAKCAAPIPNAKLGSNDAASHTVTSAPPPTQVAPLTPQKSRLSFTATGIPILSTTISSPLGNGVQGIVTKTLSLEDGELPISMDNISVPLEQRLQFCLGERCEHMEHWKRLRAKKGKIFYSCQLCGVRWRIPTKCTLLTKLIRTQKVVHLHQQI